MNPLLLALIRKVVKEGIPPDHWTVSINDRKIGPVKDAMLALKDGTVFSSRFVFTEDAADHKLEGDMPILGGKESILFDGADVDLDDIVVSHREVLLSVRLVVEYHFSKGGQTLRYRFDGRVS